ncbi:amidohydrolase family protein [Paradesertivirga mongoliensis]|uniref:Amidohydrolase family protein n=1 Tax=Paradesertivirga mongoliensis TaxID=2100740 RepID=A0ABW4ZIB6_9SPHI|nr:amidohydrolase family protein [Pedobacter mongoliensis]
MKKIDSHQHFWRFDPVRDSWITDNMKVVQRDFLPADLAPVLMENGIDGCVAVQADQSEEQNAFLLELAADNSFIKGIVGWVDLRAENIKETLEFYKGYDKMKGFRHVLQGEQDRSLMLRDEFKRGISMLEGFGYTYDILIYTDQIKYSEELVTAFPDQKFVIDHIAKPDIKNQNIDDWAADMKALAGHENVSCKISGMVTEADWQHWKAADFEPYLDVVFEAFGSGRVMFGSDWPVCEVAGGYGKVIGLVQGYTSKLTQIEQELFWGGNAIKFYNLTN